MQNFMEFNLKKFLNPKTVVLGVWGSKTSLKQFGPKRPTKP